MMAGILSSNYIFYLIILITTALNFQHGINVAGRSIVKRSDSDAHVEIINFWKQIKDKLIIKYKNKDVVLVMGNTGSGKSTLLTALTGGKMRSVKKHFNYLYVDDNDKIETGVSSKTLIPEIRIDTRRNIHYIDCSGFRDNRDIKYEISSIYFQNNLINQIKKMKLILVVNYDSVKMNGNKNDFDHLLNHVTKFIKDISKFNHGIALVITKVPLSMKLINGKYVISTNNKNILIGIETFLENKRSDYLNKANTFKNRMIIELLNILLQKENSVLTRIGIFWRPNKKKPYNDLPHAKNETNAISNMIENNLQFVEIQSNYFGFALSNELKFTLTNIVTDIYKKDLKIHLQSVSEYILGHYIQLEKQCNDIIILRDRITQAYNLYSEEIKFDKPQSLFKTLLNTVYTLNTPVPSAIIKQLSADLDKLSFFTTVLNENEPMNMLFLKDVIQNIVEFIRNLTNFYDFLNKLTDHLDTNHALISQDDIDAIKRLDSLQMSINVQQIGQLKNIINQIRITKDYQQIETLTLTKLQLRHLSAVFKAFDTKLDLLCDSSSKQLTVKGYNIKISDVIKNNCWKQAKVIQVFASNKVFIDSSINKTGEAVKLFIIAPTWEVLGRPKITLDGKADDNISTMILPLNDSAGQFFGVGNRFINPTFLMISANGGVKAVDKKGYSGQIIINSLKNVTQINTSNNISDLNPNFVIYPSINSFKEFIRDNLYQNIKESRLMDFYQAFENNSNIKTQYGIIAFMEDLKGLENQFLKLKSKINLIPFYNSLINRIEEYSNTQVKNEANKENIKILSYLYTAALTKMYALEKKRNGHTVLDLKEYINIIETSVRSIQETQHLQVTQRYQSDYYSTLTTKIHEAEDLIHNIIEPEIDRLWKDSSNQMKGITDQIEKNKNDTQKVIDILEEDKATIRRNLLIRAICLPFKLFGAALAFLGPIGIAVGIAVTGVTSITEGLLLNEVSDHKRIPSINPNFKKITHITETFDNKTKIAAEKLSLVINNLEMYVGNLSDSEPKKAEKREIIFQMKTKFQAAMVEQNKSLTMVSGRNAAIASLDQKVRGFIQSEEKFIQGKIIEENNTSSQSGKKYQTSIKILDKAHKTMDTANVVIDYIHQFQSDNAAIRNIDNQIREYSDQLKGLEEMENQVYDTLLPELCKIEDTMKSITNSLSGSSHAKLDVTKWTVRSTLRDAKLGLQQFTQLMSFELRSNLQRYIDKIEEAFSILIDVYGRIDSYSDTVKQANYIAHIASKSMTDIKITNPDLNAALQDLKLIIQSNILIEKYSIALHAFKQHYYPFAADVLQHFQLPQTLKTNDSEALRTEIINNIHNIKEFINYHSTIMPDFSEYIHEQKKFNSLSTSSSPFYVWNYNTIKNDIAKLFSGEEIIVKADIVKGLPYNAIKFNDIGINFKLKKKTLQNQLNNALKNFTLTMISIGNHYYRCGERLFFISIDDTITISYILDKDTDGNWIDPNLVYTGIFHSRAFLSPYAMWSFKLDSVPNVKSFKDLQSFVNEEMDLELIGQGYYIEQNKKFNNDVCNDDLSNHYDVETMVEDVI